MDLAFSKALVINGIMFINFIVVNIGHGMLLGNSFKNGFLFSEGIKDIVYLEKIGNVVPGDVYV